MPLIELHHQRQLPDAAAEAQTKLYVVVAATIQVEGDDGEKQTELLMIAPLGSRMFPYSALAFTREREEEEQSFVTSCLRSVGRPGEKAAFWRAPANAHTSVPLDHPEDAR